MKILFNAFSALQGGGQTYLLNLFTYSKENEVEIEVLVSKNNEKLFEGMPHLRIRCYNFWGRFLILRLFWEYFFLPFLLMYGKYDAYVSPAGFLPFKIVPFRAKRIAVCQNMLPFLQREINRFSSRKMRLKFQIIKTLQIISFKHSDLVIFISQFAKNKIEKIIQPHIFKSVVIPHGLSDLFLKENNQVSINKLDFEYVLYVSNLYDYKAHLEVLQEWKKNKINNKSLKLLFVGYKNTSYGKKVDEAISADHYLSSSVVNMGSVDYFELPPIYRNSKIIIFASSCENCPNILLESLASEKPVICSNFEPMPEFAKDSVLYFNPYQENELMNSLNQLIENDNLAKDLAFKGKCIAKNYSWTDSSNQTWDAIKGMVSSK